MAPKSVGEIISTLTQSDEAEKNVVANFIHSISEIYSHPKDEVNKTLINIKDRDIFLIRERVFLHFLNSFSEQALKDANIAVSDDNPCGALRKRYKAPCCYDDIYYLAMSIIEKAILKEVVSKVLDTKQNSNALLKSASNATALNEPVVTATEGALITEIHAIKTLLDEMKKEQKSRKNLEEMLVAIRTENKSLKNQLNLVTTKIDKQNGMIQDLQKKLNINPAVAQRPATPFPQAPQSAANVAPIHPSTVLQPPITTTSVAPIHPSAAQQAPHLNGAVTNTTRSFSEVVVNSNSTRSDGSSGGGSMANSSRDHANRYETGRNGSGQSNRDRRSRVTASRDQSSQQGKRKPVYGTKSGNQLAGKRNELNFSIFVGGLSNSIESKDLAEYIQLELNIDPLEIIVNKINQHNRSYKVVIRRQDKDHFFNPGHWEENIILKPFRERRAQTNDLPGEYDLHSYNNDSIFNNGNGWL